MGCFRHIIVNTLYKGENKYNNNNNNNNNNYIGHVFLICTMRSYRENKCVAPVDTQGR
jgi:hypothetical protein